MSITREREREREREERERESMQTEPFFRASTPLSCCRVDSCNCAICVVRSNRPAIIIVLSDEELVAQKWVWVVLSIEPIIGH